MTPLLPLDTFRALLGLHPWHFWGLADSRYVPINSKCSGLVLEYSWQGSDATGRADIRRALETAEQKLRTYLGYWPAPKYVETDPFPWPRYGDGAQVRYRDLDATGRRIAVQAPDCHIRAMGVESLTFVGTAALTYASRYSTPLQEYWTLQIATTVTDPRELAVYFTAADRFDGSAAGARWRIEPVQISIAGGIATITGASWLVVRPVLYDNPALQALDPLDGTNFVTGLEVYQRTTNGNGASVDDCQATLIYETSDCGASWGSCCVGATVGSDPGTTGQVIARAGIRDGRLGLVTPAAAVYDAGAGTWSSEWCCGTSYCDPDRVKLRYLAGAALGSDGQMDTRWQEVVTKLGAAELKRRICACRETNERLHDLQMDMALESTTTERYRRTDAQMNNPFGTRLGHIQAWLESKDHFIRRGMLA